MANIFPMQDKRRKFWFAIAIGSWCHWCMPDLDPPANSNNKVAT
jgi:hypothetical protein